MLSHSTAEMVEVFAIVGTAATAALLPQQPCLFLLVTFLDKRSSVPLRIAITSVTNSVKRLPIRISYLCLSIGS